MRKIFKIKLCITSIICLIMIGESSMAQKSAPKRIILLGASVGKGWKIENLPERLHSSFYRFEYVGDYKFDKTKTLFNILARKEYKPDAIIIKECAAYFPGNFEHYKKLINEWIYLCRKHDVVPILTTVAPVAKENSLIEIIKAFTKKYLLSRQSRIEGICLYNDWIRSFATEKGLAVLDREAALRIDENERYLNKIFDGGDGLHINIEAYNELDKIVLPLLNTIFSNFES